MWQQIWHIVLRCTICGPLGLLLRFYKVKYLNFCEWVLKIPWHSQWRHSDVTKWAILRDLMHIRGLSQKIVYIACCLKINARIELIFSHIQDKLSMHNISKYLTFMPHSNKHMASYIVLGFTVRRTSTSPSNVTLDCLHLNKFHCILFKFLKVSFSPKSHKTGFIKKSLAIFQHTVSHWVSV